jgi:hypothetical protein
MKIRWMLLLVLSVLLSDSPLYGRPPTPVPDGLTKDQKAEFMPHYLEFKRQYDELAERTKQFNAKYKNIPEDSPLLAEGKQQQALLNTDIANYKQGAQQYEADLAAVLKTRLASLDKQIPITKEQLVKATQQLKGFQESADEWITLADKARETARESAKNTLAAVLLEKLSANNESERALDEDSLKRINALLHDRVFMDDLYAQVLTVQKLDSLKTDASVIKILKTIKGTLDVSNVDLKGREGILTAVLKGIELVNKDPKIALLIADGEIAIDSAYGWLAAKEARDRVNQLLNLSGDALKGVTAISNLYEAEIRDRRSLMAALQK